MAVVVTCKCEECGLQKSFANHWVMIVERKISLTVLPVWDDKKMRRTRHFCGRAHASRFVERWIANSPASLVPDVLAEIELDPELGFSRLDEKRPEDRQDRPNRQDRPTERMLMRDKSDDAMSSVRVIPAPAAPVVAPATLRSVAMPPACALPANVLTAQYNQVRAMY